MVSKVYVIGLGMGNPDTLTCGALRALRESELVIGSSRLLDSLAELIHQCKFELSLGTPQLSSFFVPVSSFCVILLLIIQSP